MRSPSVLLLLVETTPVDVDHATVYLHLTPSATEAVSLSTFGTVRVQLTPSGVESGPYDDNETVALNLTAISTFEHGPDSDVGTIYLDLRVSSQEPGAFNETFETLDPTIWRLEDPLGPNSDLIANLANLTIVRKHATDGPSCLRLNYETQYDGSYSNDLLDEFRQSSGLFIQWIDTLLGADPTKTYWLTYSFMLERWSDVWKNGFGDPSTGYEAYLGVITLPGFATDENFNDFDTPLVLKATDRNAGDLIVQYPYTETGDSIVGFTAGVWHTAKFSHKHNTTTGDFETSMYIDGVLIRTITDNDAFPPPNPPMGINIFQTQSNAGGIVYIDDMIYSVDVEPRDVGSIETGDGTTTKQMLKMRDWYGSSVRDGGSIDIGIDVDPGFSGAVLDAWLYLSIYIPESFLQDSTWSSNDNTGPLLTTYNTAGGLDNQELFLHLRRQSGVWYFGVGGNTGFGLPVTGGWYEIHAHVVQGLTTVELIINGIPYTQYIEAFHTHLVGPIDAVGISQPDWRADNELYYHDGKWWIIEELAVSLNGRQVRADNYDLRFPFQNVDIEDIAYLIDTVGDPPSWPPYWATGGSGDWSNSLIENFPAGPGLPEALLTDEATVYLNLEVSTLDIYSTTYDDAVVYLYLDIRAAQAYGSTDLATVYLDMVNLGFECYSTWLADFLGEGEANLELYSSVQVLEIVGAENLEWSSGDVVVEGINC